MKIYLDTADVAQIERLLATNLFSGVTSNPAILKSAGLGPSTAQKFYACAKDEACQVPLPAKLPKAAAVFLPNRVDLAVMEAFFAPESL